MFNERRMIAIFRFSCTFTGRGKSCKIDHWSFTHCIWTGSQAWAHHYKNIVPSNKTVFQFEREIYSTIQFNYTLICVWYCFHGSIICSQLYFYVMNFYLSIIQINYYQINAKYLVTDQSYCFLFKFYYYRLLNTVKKVDHSAGGDP